MNPRYPISADNTAYPLVEDFSLGRAVENCLSRDKLPQHLPELEAFNIIRAQFGKYAAPLPEIGNGSASNSVRPTFRGSGNRVAYVPFSAFGYQQRADLGGNTFATITEIRPQYTTGLVAHSQVFRAGTSFIEGLDGQVMLTGTTALPATAFSGNVDGTSAMPNAAPVFTGGSAGSNSMIFDPLRLGVKFLISNTLLTQASPIFEPVLREQISRAISGKLDDLALFGTGTSNGQPLGVFSTVTPTNLGATPMTWANFKSYQQAILQADLDPDSFGVIVSPAMQAYLDSTLAYSGGSYSVWERSKPTTQTSALSVTKLTLRHRWRQERVCSPVYGAFYRS